MSDSPPQQFYTARQRDVSRLVFNQRSILSRLMWLSAAIRGYSRLFFPSTEIVVATLCLFDIFRAPFASRQGGQFLPKCQQSINWSAKAAPSSSISPSLLPWRILLFAAAF